MSVASKFLIAPHQLPKRALGLFVGYHEKYDRILLLSENVIYQRGLDNPLDVDVTVKHSAKLTVASYSPNARWIASADETGKVFVWTPQNADKTVQIESQPITGPIFDIAWTGDSERLGCVGQGSRGYGAALNASTGSSLGEASGHSGVVRTCCLKPNRPFRWVTAGDDFQAVFYKGPPFRMEGIKQDHSKFVLCARYAPDGSVWATSSLDGKICVYGSEDQALVQTIDAKSGVPCFAFAQDSKTLIAAQLDCRTVEYDVATGEAKRVWSFPSDIQFQQHGVVLGKNSRVSFSLNGDLNFLKDDGSIVTEYGHAGGLVSIAAGPGGLFVSGDTNGRALIYQGTRAIACQDEQAPVSSVVVQGGKFVVARCDAKISVLNQDGSEAARFEVGKKGSQLASLDDAVVGFTGKSLFRIAGGALTEVAVEFTPSAINGRGKEIVVGGADKLVRVFDADLKQTEVLSGLTGPATAVAFSGDGTRVAAAGEGKEIVVWQRGTAEPLHEGWRFHSLPITKLLWQGPNELVTVSKDRSIRLWSLLKKRATPEFPRAHEGQVIDATWADETTLLTAGTDGAIKSWTITPVS